MLKWKGKKNCRHIVLHLLLENTSSPEMMYLVNSWFCQLWWIILLLSCIPLLNMLLSCKQCECLQSSMDVLHAWLSSLFKYVMPVCRVHPIMGALLSLVGQTREWFGLEEEKASKQEATAKRGEERGCWSDCLHPTILLPSRLARGDDFHISQSQPIQRTEFPLRHSVLIW